MWFLTEDTLCRYRIVITTITPPWIKIAIKDNFEKKKKQKTILRHLGKLNIDIR